MVEALAVDPDFLIKDEAELRALFPPTHEMAALKSLPELDGYAEEFLTRSPFFCIGTEAPNGAADVSPRGDPEGFVKMLDPKTLLIPDRPGNNRLDTLANIVSKPNVGLLFLIPGFDETMRINGTAQVTRDPALLAKLAVHDRTPTVAIVVTVAEVFFHCAKAFRRAKLWDPEQRQDRSEMPSLAKILLDQTTGAPEDADELSQIETDLEESYERTLY